jgi:hypothetical protein
MAQTKTLQGVIRITENGDYNLVLPSNGARAQNELAINNVEEVFLIVENISSPAINIYLPKISDFNGGWNTKIYFLSKAVGGRDLYVNINSYSSETYTDWLNQEGITTTTGLGQNFFIHIQDNNYWLVK